MNIFNQIENILDTLGSDAETMRQQIKLDKEKENIFVNNENHYTRNSHLKREVVSLRSLKEINKMLNVENKSVIQNNNSLRLKTEELKFINKLMVTKSTQFSSLGRISPLNNDETAEFDQRNNSSTASTNSRDFFSRKIDNTANNLKNKRNNVKGREKDGLLLKETFKKLKIIYN